MAQTYAEQLDSVQAAIAKIEAGGQSATILGRTVSRADLRTLYDREAWLRKMVARSERGGIRVSQGIPL